MCSAGIPLRHIQEISGHLKPLNTFTDALEAFRTAMSFRFVEWLNRNRNVFFAYEAAFGFIWA
jgi:hypothetical protein